MIDNSVIIQSLGDWIYKIKLINYLNIIFIDTYDFAEIIINESSNFCRYINTI